ncbi:MAG: cbb3-type cytochrome c oxidase subunit II [Planctomycetaceae bacterium]
MPGWNQRELNFKTIPDRVRAASFLGAPYTDSELQNAIELAHAQARQIAKDIVTQNGPAGLEDKQVVALIAYLQRVGTDLFKPAPVAAPAEQPVAAQPVESERQNDQGYFAGSGLQHVRDVGVVAVCAGIRRQGSKPCG